MTESHSRSPRPRQRSPASQDTSKKDSQPSDRRQDRKPVRKDAGFKWKEKRRDDDESRGKSEGQRGRNTDQYKPRSRSRSPRRRDYDRRDDRYHGEEKRRDRDRDRDRDHRRDRKSDRNDRDKDERQHRSERKEKNPKSESEKKSAPATATPVMPQQEMIIVTVNDRLGTKKQIPCFPSDTVKDFKIIVASMIGRKPHEIMLKRQGERPFKDVLTLQDYGVSNNVQLDLEVDTGD